MSGPTDDGVVALQPTDPADEFLDALRPDDPLVAILSGREFERLVTAANVAEQGAFLLAMFSTPASRRTLTAQLRRRIAPQPLFEHTVTPEQPDISAYLERLTEAQRRQRAVVCVYDIQAGWPDAARWLDFQRDRLARYPHTLIVWLPGELRGKLAQAAPNFFSRHSGVFDLRLSAAVAPADRAPTAPVKAWADEPAGYATVEEWQQLHDRNVALLNEYEADPHSDPQAQVELHRRLGRLYAGRADYRQARAHFQKAYALLDQAAEPGAEADLLYQIGRMRYYADEYFNALEAYGQALGLFRQVGDRLGEANVLKAIGDVQNFRDDRDAALDSYAAALGLFRQVGARLGEANVLKAIGDVQNFRKELDAALDSYAAALGLFRQVGARLGEANVLKAIGDVQNFRKELDAALDSYAAALGLFRQVGARLGEANVLQAQGFCELDAGRNEEGIQALDTALGLYRQIGERVGQANIYWGLGLRLAQAGALAEAEPLLAEAVRLGNEFAPGHPATNHMEDVLAQVRARLR